MNDTYIEQHYSLSVLNYEGLWEMTFKNPFNKEAHVSILIEAPNSNIQNTVRGDRQIVKPGPRLTEILSKLLMQIEAYPYSWDLGGKKIVSYGYDFESNLVDENISTIDLTEIAFREVVNHYNFYSPLVKEVVREEDVVSGKGVMVKLKITLNKPQQVNHLAIDYFTEYPMELVSLMYEKGSRKKQELYEIPLLEAVSTNSSVYLHFSPVFTRVFYLIVRQESYLLENKPVSSEEVAQKEVWDQASEKSKQMYEASAQEYMDAFYSSVAGVQLHQEIMDSYRNVNATGSQAGTASMNRYMESFAEAKKKLDSSQR